MKVYFRVEVGNFHGYFGESGDVCSEAFMLSLFNSAQIVGVMDIDGRSGKMCEVRGHSVGHYCIGERVVFFVSFCYTTRKGVGDVGERPGSVLRVGVVVVVIAMTVGVIIKMRVRTIGSPASSATTSSLAVSMWSSTAILAVTEFIDFSSEGGDQSKEFFSRRGLWPVSHS
ncbi:hypothetical protein PIB30_059334 [Stylosanthes scabra]|uniref:Uncharacterized protein n=1 Tax=Stylosanthes scabra TaxID=79078 RepID=A0ABU6SK77_9FABA|nr:hypothetical protein [Stylosanthes scabra]